MLRRRAEFLRIRGGLRLARPAFVVEAKSRAGSTPPTPIAAELARFGLTVTKKLGGAVARNRIRRRLRAALRAVAHQAASPGFDYVLIAREGAAELEFARLVSDLDAALRNVHTAKPQANPSRRRPADGKSSLP